MYQRLVGVFACKPHIINCNTHRPDGNNMVCTRRTTTTYHMRYSHVVSLHVTGGCTVYGQGPGDDVNIVGVPQLDSFA